MTSARRGDGLGVIDTGDPGIDQAVVYVASLPDGPIVVLTGVAALTYRVLRSGSPHPHDDLAAVLGVAVGDVDQDALDDFAAELAEQALL